MIFNSSTGEHRTLTKMSLFCALTQVDRALA
jgi:hypothetical protein